MASKRLTSRDVEALQPGDYAFCGQLAGFGVRRQLGRPSFIYRYRLNGRRASVTIGVFGRPWTVDQARSKALELGGMVARGIDPAAEKRAARVRGQSFSAVAEAFLAEHVEAKRKLTTQKEYRRLLELHAKPALGRKPIDEIEHADVARLHRAMRATPRMANLMVAVLGKLFAWAEMHGLRREGRNPARQIEKYAERHVERFVSSEELGRLGATLAGMEQEGSIDPFAAAAVKLLILTGARRGEVLSLQWAWIDLAAGIARLPDSKTGAKTLHLNPAALEVIERLPRTEGNPHVIAGAKAGAAFVGLPKVWSRLRKRAHLDDVRIHDLRHSFASVAAESGVSLYIIGKLLGHTQSATTARYAHLSPDPLKATSDVVAERIKRALRGGALETADEVAMFPAANVSSVQFRKS